MIHTLLITLIIANSSSPYDYKDFASKIINDTQQMSCLDVLWTKESNWTPTSRNPHSTAYGIPQILGMNERNPYRQIIKGLDYIKARYGTPCKALTHHRQTGTY
jgi:hypothetical protein